MFFSYSFLFRLKLLLFRGQLCSSSCSNLSNWFVLSFDRLFDRSIDLSIYLSILLFIVTQTTPRRKRKPFFLSKTNNNNLKENQAHFIESIHFSKKTNTKDVFIHFERKNNLKTRFHHFFFFTLCNLTSK